ncbi:hypothetical protein C0989_008772 [Termitomyces sp. Mn162]|nr:hypothetical protein C0989_008772 [Termitomyces sp. Mn162]
MSVNDLLHTLRGEQFRHAQNLRRSRTHVSSSLPRTLPALPIDFDTDERIPSTTAAQTPAWRSHALSLVIPALPGVPTLTNLCLRVLASLPAHEFTHDIVPWLPPHLRRDLVRHTAIHAPLGDAKLWALYEPDGHADTELIVVSPQATLSNDYFIRSATPRSDWDTDSGAEPLGTLVLVSTYLATSTLLSLPPTITRMALVNLPAAIPLHRLPNTCPLLVVLDLSYNSWLSVVEESEKALEWVEWKRWSKLSILGLRGCAVSSTLIGKLNTGRWDDVEVVQ